MSDNMINGKNAGTSKPIGARTNIPTRSDLDLIKGVINTFDCIINAVKSRDFRTAAMMLDGTEVNFFASSEKENPFQQMLTRHEKLKNIIFAILTGEDNTQSNLFDCWPQKTMSTDFLEKREEYRKTALSRLLSIRAEVKKYLKEISRPKTRSVKNTLKKTGKKLAGGFKKPGDFGKGLGESRARVRLPKRLQRMRSRIFLP